MAAKRAEAPVDEAVEPPHGATRTGEACRFG
jgi:hypothetical protein